MNGSPGALDDHLYMNSCKLCVIFACVSAALVPGLDQFLLFCYSTLLKSHRTENTNKLYLGLIIKLHSENIMIYILYI